MKATLILGNGAVFEGQSIGATHDYWQHLRPGV